MVDRKITLLKAFRQLLKAQESSYYVNFVLSETVFYDGANCDGYCLLNDIESELDMLKDEDLKDRKVILLKACRDLLKKQDNSSYVLDILSETVYYDEADCDGYCLLEDIEIELDLDSDDDTEEDL